MKHRALIRIVNLDPLTVVVPGWDVETHVQVGEHESPNFGVRIGQRLHARVNLGAVTPYGLEFEKWEPK